MLNKAIDREAISNSVSIEVSKHIKTLKDELATKNQQIADLNKKYSELEEKYDALEQYTRKRSLRIDGMPEHPDENTHDVVLDMCNNVLQLDPPVLLQDIDNSHLLNPAVPKADGRPRTLLVKFTNYRARQRVFQSRSTLKTVNARKQYRRPRDHTDQEETAAENEDMAHDDDDTGDPDGDTAPSMTRRSAAHYETIKLTCPIYLNEDLSRARSLLSFDARKLRRDGKIADTWVFDGRIKIKTLNNLVVNINKKQDLDNFRWYIHLICQINPKLHFTQRDTMSCYSHTVLWQGHLIEQHCL